LLLLTFLAVVSAEELSGVMQWLEERMDSEASAAERASRFAGLTPPGLRGTL
jgi:hypothetical protein